MAVPSTRPRRRMRLAAFLAPAVIAACAAPPPPVQTVDTPAGRVQVIRGGGGALVSVAGLTPAPLDGYSSARVAGAWKLGRETVAAIVGRSPRCAHATALAIAATDGKTHLLPVRGCAVDYTFLADAASLSLVAPADRPYVAWRYAADLLAGPFPQPGPPPKPGHRVRRRPMTATPPADATPVSAADTVADAAPAPAANPAAPPPAVDAAAGLGLPAAVPPRITGAVGNDVIPTAVGGTDRAAPPAVVNLKKR